MTLIRTQDTAEGVLLTVSKEVGSRVDTSYFMFNSPCEAEAYAHSSFA